MNDPIKTRLPLSVLQPGQDILGPVPAPVPEGMFAAVVDDDPTGIQTVHGVDVYMDYSQDALTEAAHGGGCFFIQTNSRAMDAREAVRVNALVMERLVNAARAAGKDFAVISRSDSTLRGHYPQETLALRETYEKLTGNRIDGEILVPFFLEGGRYTIGDVHYVREGGELVPAGETEFARDSAFGYKSSDLKEYVSEKHGGAVRPGGVASISLDDLRNGGAEAYRKLTALSGFGKMIVNATSYADLAALAFALRRAEASGKRFIYRTAASFVRAYCGIGPRPLLGTGEILADAAETAGLVVVGSHVRKTTDQLLALLELPQAAPIEADVAALLDTGAERDREITRCARAADQALADGRLPVLYTSRNVVTAQGGTGGENLKIARAVSDGVVGIVRAITRKPAFLIAKGGITSSDVATKALGVKKARVLGQIRPGVPVVRCGPESRFPGLAYIIFPGNVGTREDLRDAASALIIQTGQ